MSEYAQYNLAGIGSCLFLLLLALFILIDELRHSHFTRACSWILERVFPPRGDSE